MAVGALDTSGSPSVVLEAPAREAVERPRPDVAAWGWGKRMLFRFGFSYLLLYILPFPLNLVPYGPIAWLLEGYLLLWNGIVSWAGEFLFGINVEVLPNGSGDTTYNYVQLVCYVLLAALAMAIWTLVDSRRAHHEGLVRASHILLRFYLATTLISYGAYKVLPSQFPAPSLDRLLQPFGDASPMGILWTFMGASAAYTIFSGAAEMLGGLLLTVRRTATLGALVSAAVLLNIVLLNYCYDVPVKLFSSHLLVMAGILVLPDLGRLANVLVRNRPAEPAVIAPLFKSQRLERASIALRTLFVLAIVGQTLWQSHEGRRLYGDLAEKSPLRGIWEIQEIRVDGTAQAPIAAGEERWRRVVFDYPQMIGIQLMSGSRQRYALKLDAEKKTLLLTKRDDPKWKSELRYRQSGANDLALDGTFEGHKLAARLQKKDESEFLLTTRGFHWINEYPFNR